MRQEMTHHSDQGFLQTADSQWWTENGLRGENGPKKVRFLPSIPISWQFLASEAAQTPWGASGPVRVRGEHLGQWLTDPRPSRCGRPYWPSGVSRSMFRVCRSARYREHTYEFRLKINPHLGLFRRFEQNRLKQPGTLPDAQRRKGRTPEGMRPNETRKRAATSKPRSRKRSSESSPRARGRSPRTASANGRRPRRTR